MSEVVVLGPTGSIGSHLLRFLHSNGIGARTGNRKDFDYFNPRTYDPLFRGATHLFLLTPVVDSMVELTSVLLTAARRSGIQRIVKISAMGAAMDSRTRLFRWHAECEKLVHESGIPYVSLRPNALMQNFIQHYSMQIRKNSLIAVPAKDARISFVHAEDVAKVAYLSLFEERLSGKILDLTGPTALLFSQIAADLTAVLGRPIGYVNVSDEQARLSMTQPHIPPSIIEAVLELYASYRRGEAASVTTTIEELTGKPAENFKNFVSQHAKEFQ